MESGIGLGCGNVEFRGGWSELLSSWCWVCYMALVAGVLACRLELLMLPWDEVVDRQSECLNPHERWWAVSRSADHVLLLSSLLAYHTVLHRTRPEKGRPSTSCPP